MFKIVYQTGPKSFSKSKAYTCKKKQNASLYVCLLFTLGSPWAGPMANFAMWRLGHLIGTSLNMTRQIG